MSAFSGAGLLQGIQTRIADYFAGNSESRGGVRLAVKDLYGDGLADLGAGAGDGSRVTAYAGKTVVRAKSPDPLFGSDAAPGFSGGVFVG